MIEAIEFTCGRCQAANRLKTRQLFKMRGAPRCGQCKKPLFRALDKDFSDLDAAVYQHPLDAEALQKLQHVPGIKTLLRKVIKSTVELNLRLSQTANTVQLGPQQMPQVYARFEQAAARLGITPLPELYAVQNPYPNATTYGVEQYFVTITTGALELLDDEEQLAVFAHELGHIHSDHMLYKTAARFISALATRLAAVSFGLGGLIALPLQLALLWWDRCAELTADRAALLVVRRPEVLFRMLMKLAGGSPQLLQQMNIDAFMQQADQLERMSAASSWARTLVFVQELFRTHPFPVYRTRELVEWISSGNYLEILDGDYAKASDNRKSCPVCAGQIAAELTICPHCAASLAGNGTGSSARSAQATQDKDTQKQARKKNAPKNAPKNAKDKASDQANAEAHDDVKSSAAGLADEVADIWADLFSSAGATIKGAGEVLREAADDAADWLQSGKAHGVSKDAAKQKDSEKKQEQS